MTWFKENKFLAGLLIFTLIGVGVFGWLLYAAESKYDANSAEFDQQVTELHRLESLPAYPDKDNLDVLEAQRVAHLGLIDDLQKSLAAAQIPSEAITPNGFQDQLRIAVTQFATKATALVPPIEIPKGFYLGFTPYQSAPPTPEAAAPLSRELKVIQTITQLLIDNHVDKLTRFDREPLPEEKKAGAAAAAATPKPAVKPGAKAGPTTEPLLKAHALELGFVTDQKSFQAILNALTSKQDQFLIPRAINIQNSQPHAPPKVAPVTTPQGEPGQPPPVEPDKPAKSPMIFGEEKVEVVIHLEIVDFTKPAPPAPPVGRNPGR